jgi:acetyl-CoA acetyltransferase
MPRHPLCGAAAIAGLGITAQGKVYGHSALDFAVEAVTLALADAGLERSELDGVLLNPGSRGRTSAWGRSSSSRRWGSGTSASPRP